MPALSINVPFPVFQDRDGQPLDNGYIWIGQPNLNPQTNPVVAYYDDALTIVATQPLRTINGYVSRAGTPAQVYVDAVNFSILVQDSKGSMVYNFPEGAGISPNASGVVYDPAGTGAVVTTVQAKLRENVSVKDFGAVGDGVTNDRAAIQAAFNASKQVFFPSGTYWMGSYSTAENIIDLSALGQGISIYTDKSVEFVCQTTANVIPKFFYLFNNGNFHCGPVKFRDTGYDGAVSWRGAWGFYLNNDTSSSGNWGDLTFESIYSRNLVGSVAAAGGDATHRIRGIYIGQLFSDDCYYGYNGQNQGDGVVIDNLIAYFNHRPYFVYGVVDHRVKIFSRNNRGTSASVNICRQVGGLNTKGLDITYVARDQTQNITHVLINHIDLLGGEISNIKLSIDIESSISYAPLRFVNYTGSGGSETSAASSNQVYDIQVSGSCDSNAAQVTCPASYASKRRLSFTSGQNFSFDSTITSKFYLNSVLRSNPVTWTAVTTQPSIGNGTLYYDLDIVDGLVHYSVTMIAGSTTNFGVGEWSFAVPYVPSTTAIGSAWVLKNGAAYYIGAVKMAAGAGVAACYANGVGTGFGSAVPITWAANDQLRFSITYPIS